MWSLRDSECVSQTVKQADGQTDSRQGHRQTDVQVEREASSRQTDIVKETDSQKETVNKSNK